MGDGTAAAPHWPEERVVAEAFKRFEAFGSRWDLRDPKIRQGVRPLLSEAGWTEDELLDALLRHFGADRGG